MVKRRPPEEGAGAVERCGWTERRPALVSHHGQGRGEAGVSRGDRGAMTGAVQGAAARARARVRAAKQGSEGGGCGERTESAGLRAFGRDVWDGEACTGRTRAVAAATSAGRARWCVEQGRPVRVATERRAERAHRGRGGRGLTGVAETRVGEARWSLWGGGRGRRQRRGGGPAKAWRFQRGAPAWWRGREAPAEVGSGALPRSSRGR